MGNRPSLSVSIEDCGICGSELSEYRKHLGGGSNGGSHQTGGEASVQLTCKHLFHPSCIRGWTLVGGFPLQTLLSCLTHMVQMYELPVKVL